MRILLFFIFFIISVYASFAKNEQDTLYSTLNKELGNKEFYMKKKETHINNLKRLLNIQDLSPVQEYDINYKLHKEYNKYMLDSAIYYMEKNIKIAENLKNKILRDEINLKLACLYSSTGMYIESNNILNSVNRQSLPQHLLSSYYDAYSQFYEHYAQSNSRHTYYAENESYRDSLLMVLDSQSVKYQTVYALKILYQGQLEIAEKRLLVLMDKTTEADSDYALIAYLLGYVYERKQKIDLQKKYYTLSAIADIKNATKDNASLQSLALTYYKIGDIDLAHRLMESAREDAVFCSVRFRTIETTEFYSIINGAYQAKEEKQKKELQLYLILISISTSFLIIAIVYVYKQMKRLSKIRKELYHTNVKLTELNESISTANDQLSQANFQLSESNQVKEEYIAHFFDLCSVYINKLEDYRKVLNKKATTNQLTELFKMLKSTTLVDNEFEELYKKFDNIFLNLFPSFVEEFNSLLIKEERIILKQGELLNTELRIFALIRLGITDSVKIAGFLRYSLSTIYNYRTKARNKAAVSRDKFEEMVIKIGVIQKKR